MNFPVSKKTKLESVSKLQVGDAYLWKDGTVELFVGEAIGVGRKIRGLVFYRLARVVLTENKQMNTVSILDLPNQISNLMGYTKSLVLNNKPVREGVQIYGNMPDIMGALFRVAQPEVIKQWRRNAVFEQLEFSNDDTASLSDNRGSSEFVSAKDLELGRLYYTSNNPRGRTYMYLGRGANGEYAWLRIADVEVFRRSPESYVTQNAKYGIMSEYFELTKANKKCKAMTVEADTSKEWNGVITFKVYYDDVTLQSIQNQVKERTLHLYSINVLR